MFNNEIMIKGFDIKILRLKFEVYFIYFCMGYGRILVDVYGI